MTDRAAQARDTRLMGTLARRLIVTVAATAAVVTLAACSSDSSSMPGMTSGHHMSSSTAGSSAAPTEQGTPAAGEHNQADVMFSMMMIPHHAQAIEMSDLILAKTGVAAEVTALARQIKAAQAPEIAQMRGWLAGWGLSAPPTQAGMAGMPGMGMVSEADMTKLKAADGAEAQRLFLTGMIAHHEGAIDMAEDVLRDGVNAEVKTLAQAIITSQQAEIATMRQLLGG